MRAQVIDFELQRQLAPYMGDLQPLPGVYDPDFIAANQGARADNVVKGSKQVMRLPLSSRASAVKRGCASYVCQDCQRGVRLPGTLGMLCM